MNNAEKNSTSMSRLEGFRINFTNEYFDKPVESITESRAYKNFTHKLFQLFTEYHIYTGLTPPAITSGYRSSEKNRLVGGAEKSLHQRGLAVDFDDKEGMLDRFCINNQEFLDTLGLYQEHPRYTKGWCHLQSVPPKSGQGTFVPYSGSVKSGQEDDNFEI